MTGIDWWRVLDLLPLIVPWAIVVGVLGAHKKRKDNLS